MQNSLVHALGLSFAICSFDLAEKSSIEFNNDAAHQTSKRSTRIYYRIC